MGTPPIQYNQRFIAFSRTFSCAAGMILMGVGALVLIGWTFGIAALKGVPGGITMKANAAIAFLLAGASLSALTMKSGRSFIVRIGQVCAGIVALIGAATLSQHIAGWDLGIDQLLFVEMSSLAATVSPGRMGPPASTCFTLAGIALLLLHARRNVTLAQILAAVAGVWALLAVIGYAYEMEALYSIARYTGIALHTAVSLFLLSLGLLSVRADQGIMATISCDHEGGMMARRLLIPAVIAPSVLGWLCMRGERLGFYDLGTGIALLAVTIIIIFSLIIWESAVKLNRVEYKRRIAEAAVTRHQEGLKRQAVLLAHANERFQLAEQASNGFIYDWDMETGEVKRTEGMQRILGYHPDESEPTAAWWSGLIHPDDAEHITCEAQVVRERGDTTWSSQYRVRHHDGHYVYMWDRGLIIRNDEGRVIRVVGSNVDITEYKRIEREREELYQREQELRRQAEEAGRLKDEFLATVSHELRTPLNAILGWVTLLQIDQSDEAATRRALETIERNAKLQAQLVEDLLDVSRIVTDRLRLNLGHVDLASVINAAIDAVLPGAEAKDIAITTDLAPAIEHTHGDAERLQQVIWNLLSNALKFTPKGGSVAVRLERRDSKAHITVSDSGEGISPEFLPHVFDRFLQADGSTTRRHGGLGLGLAIARHLIDMHGGTIKAESAGVGQGATFTVQLPLLAVSVLDHDRTSVQVEARKDATAPDLHAVRILSIDDEADTRQMLRGILQHFGAEVNVASSSQEGLEILHVWKPDLIISDIGMPHEDGLTFIRKVRSLALEYGRDIPAIALTGYVRIEDRMRALEAGYQMFVPKPVEVNELMAVIVDLLKSAPRPIEQR